MGLITDIVNIAKHHWNRPNKKAFLREWDFLPKSKIRESAAAVQSYCPKCPYGTGTTDYVIAGGSHKIIQTCSVCNTVYASIIAFEGMTDRPSGKERTI